MYKPGDIQRGRMAGALGLSALLGVSWLRGLAIDGSPGWGYMWMQFLVEPSRLFLEMCRAAHTCTPRSLTATSPQKQFPQRQGGAHKGMGGVVVTAAPIHRSEDQKWACIQ